MIFGLTMLLKPGRKPLEIDTTSFVTVSADCNIVAGTRQDFVIYLLNPTGRLPTPETTKSLSASLILSAKRPVTLEADARQIAEGAYAVSFDIPDIELPQQANLEIRDTKTGKPLFRASVPTGDAKTLLVIPQADVVYAGSWLNIRLATLCRKSGKGVFKSPVRVKLKTPTGHQTVNRIVHSDINGTAVFTTHLNNNVAGGIYSCEFSHGREKVSLRLNVKSLEVKRRNRAKAMQKRDINPLKTMLGTGNNSSEPQHYYFATPINQHANSTAIEEVNIDKTRIYLSYNCPDSNWRQIEVWQNGKIHYSANLQLAAGRVSLSFTSPLQSDIPIKLKLWYLGTEGIRVCEQTFYRSGEQQNPINMFFKSADRLFGDNGSTVLAKRAMHTQGVFANNHGEKISIININKALEQIIEPVVPPATDFNIIRETPARLLKSDTRQKPGRRFFLVDDELQLSRYKFSSLKIWHQPKRFLGSLIGALTLERSSIAFLIGEAEIRAIRMQYLSIAERPAELEKLEGLLAPLCEFFEFCEDKTELKSAWEPGILRAISRLSEHVPVPEKLAAALKAQPANKTMIGPFSPVLPVEIELDALMPTLKPGGKVILLSNNRQMPINLSGDVSIFSSKSFSGKNEHFEKLVNSRALPVVVELDFAGAADN